MQEYSFLNVLTLINNFPLTGWAEGDDVIQIERRVDGFNDSVGADGRMLVSQDANKSGTMVFRLQQQSEGNAYLADLYGRQEGANGIFVPLQIMVKNIASGEMSQGSFGYLKKPAKVTRGTGVNGQEWIIVVERLDSAFGILPAFLGVSVI